VGQDGALVFLHTGGAPAVFGYGADMLEGPENTTSDPSVVA